MKIKHIWMPRWFLFNAVTLSPYIFVRNTTAPQNFDRLIKHENTHIEQQNKVGLFRFLWLYFFDAKFRMFSEIEAMLAAGASREEIFYMLECFHKIEFGSYEITNAINFCVDSRLKNKNVLEGMYGKR
jgi:hypothetical protein